MSTRQATRLNGVEKLISLLKNRCTPIACANRRPYYKVANASSRAKSVSLRVPSKSGPGWLLLPPSMLMMAPVNDTEVAAMLAFPEPNEPAG